MIAAALLFSSPAAFGLAKPLQDRYRYCIPQGATWALQNYAPLVDTRNGTTYVQAAYNGASLQRILVKTYTRRIELVYEYKFGEDGKLMALHGWIDRWGRWFAEADLFPDADGTIPKPDITYRLAQFGGIIQAPEDGPDYTRVFSTVKIYRTIADAPCAVLLKEAEKKNATQE